MAESQASITVIGADTIIKGEMIAQTRAKILGRFEGTIEAKGSIEVADKAECLATVAAKVVQIDGLMQGNVTAGDTVQLNASAQLQGDVTAAKLVVAEGASLDGHFKIGAAATNGNASKPAASPTSSSGGGEAKKK